MGSPRYLLPHTRTGTRTPLLGTDKSVHAVPPEPPPGEPQHESGVFYYVRHGKGAEDGLNQALVSHCLPTWQWLRRPRKLYKAQREPAAESSPSQKASLSSRAVHSPKLDLFRAASNLAQPSKPTGRSMNTQEPCCKRSV